MDKHIIRESLKNKRNQLAFCDRTSKSSIIQKKAIDLVFSKNISIVLSYMNAFSEVESNFFNQYLLDNGIILAIPRVDSKSKINFYKISNLEDDTKLGSFGIIEPKRRLGIINYNSSNMLIVIPGVSFDLEGYRLGYGKGFYDYFLFRNPFMYRVGLAFNLQMVNKLPIDTHDQKVDCLITEDKNYNFKRNY